MSHWILPAGPGRRDELLRLLGRRDQLGALTILSEISGVLAPPPSDLIGWGRSHHPGENHMHRPDKDWLLSSIAQHVADGRFEHATILVERYAGCHCPSAPSPQQILMVLPSGGAP